jgi:hypothetical protein
MALEFLNERVERSGIVAGELQRRCATAISSAWRHQGAGQTLQFRADPSRPGA